MKNRSNVASCFALSLLCRRAIVCLAVIVLSWNYGAISAYGQYSDVWPKQMEGADKLVYKSIGDVDLHLFVFRPATKRKAAPGIVFFFGGGWKSGSPIQFEKHCRYLASRGMVAMTAEYRNEDRHRSKAKDSVQDAKSAMRWIRANAQKLGVDPKRLAAGGGSAGGHLAACAAMKIGATTADAQSAVPNALVLFNPPCVLAAADGREDFMAAEYKPEILARMGVPSRELSMWHHVKPKCPPLLVMHGEADHAVPIWTAKSFVDKMKRAGNHAEIVIYPGEDHGFFNFGEKDNAMFFATLKATDRFLAKLGWIQGAPTLDKFPF